MAERPLRLQIFCEMYCIFKITNLPFSPLHDFAQRLRGTPWCSGRQRWQREPICSRLWEGGEESCWPGKVVKSQACSKEIGGRCCRSWWECWRRSRRQSNGGFLSSPSSGCKTQPRSWSQRWRQRLKRLQKGNCAILLRSPRLKIFSVTSSLMFSLSRPECCYPSISLLSYCFLLQGLLPPFPCSKTNVNLRHFDIKRLEVIIW